MIPEVEAEEDLVHDDDGLTLPGLNQDEVASQHLQI
jgi:hypothetical protein